MLRPAALIVATLLLAGCTPSEPAVTPAPEPTAASIFASDEEALAAATEAYAKFVAAVDKSLSDFSIDALDEFAEGEALESALTNAEEYQQVGKHQIGHVEVVSSTPTDLQSVLQSDADQALVQIYACIDLSEVDVLDGEGNSVVKPDRPDRVYQLVSLIWHVEETSFKVSDEEVWENEC